MAKGVASRPDGNLAVSNLPRTVGTISVVAIFEPLLQALNPAANKTATRGVGKRFVMSKSFRRGLGIEFETKLDLFQPTFMTF